MQGSNCLRVRARRIDVKYKVGNCDVDGVRFLEMARIDHLDGTDSRLDCAGTVESHGGRGNATPPP